MGKNEVNMLYAVKKSFLALALTLGFVSQGFAANCAADYVPPENPVWNGSAKTEPCMKDGYYIIDNAAKLAWYAANYTKGDAKLAADLDLGGHNWIPIAAGDGKKKYGKTFDGNNHRISNFTIDAEYLISMDSTYAQNLGFIGCLNGTVKNLIIENISVYGYGSGFLKDKVDTEAKPLSIGTVVGWQSGSSKVDGCYVTGKIITSGDGQAVGGVVGNIGGGVLSNCVSYASIDANGKAYVGGIVGYAKSYENGKDSISSCVYAGNSLSSTGSGAVGGIVGYQYKGDVTVSDVVYDSDLSNDGKPINGFGATKDGTVNGTSNPDLNFLGAQTSSQTELNEEDIVCALNGRNDDSTCKTEPWSMGESSLSLNGYGADGYKITFDANGGSFSNGSTMFVKYVKADYIINNEGVENPSWDDDRAFAGWSSKNTSEDAEAYMNPANGVVTIKAIWNPVYTITFSPVNGNLNGTFPDGSTTPKTAKVEQGKQISVQGFDRPTSFTQEGVKYNFVGWANENNPTVAYVTNGLDNLPVATGNMTLVAVWTTVDVWTVSFFANDESVASYVSSVYDNDKATEWTAERTGYTFAGWYENENFEGLSFDFDQVITKDYNLYAKWNQNSYNITYVLDCSDECMNPNEAQYTVDGFNLSDPTWDDAHRFLGWYTDAAFKNKVESISAGETGDLTLYAEWETIVYEITYRAGEFGNGTVDPEYKMHGVDYTIRGVTYTRKGYIQNGWSTSKDGEKVYDFGAEYSANAPLTLYPTWEIAHYSITYVCDDCTDDNNPDSYTMFDADLKFANPIFPGNNQYLWKGWYKDAAFTQSIQTIKKGSTGDTTIYGKLLKYYNITYELNGKNVKANNTVRYHVEFAVELKGPDPASIDGYTFAGWYDNAEFAGEPVTEIPLGSTGDKKFYAKWDFVPVVTQSGAVTITEYEDGSKEAVINGTYGGGDVANPDEADTVQIATDVVVNSVVLNRTFNENKVATLYLPFEIDTANINGATIYKFKTVVKSEEDGRWKFKVTKAAKVLPNTPYVALPSASQVTFDIPESVTLNTTTAGEEAASGAWEFRGVYTYTVFTADPENPVYFFADQVRDGAKLGEFVITGTGAWLNPMRAYLIYHKGGLAKSARGNLGSNIMLPDELDIVVEDENGIVVETGRLNTVTGEVRMDRWFDLKGRKLNSKPTVKGTYYKNGKRVIIK